MTIFSGRPYVNNTYRSSKLFINDNIDDIVTFKRKKNVQVVKTTNDEQGEVVQKEETEVFWCSECQNNVVPASPRFNTFTLLHLLCLWLVGIVTLTLFDREVSEILNITGREVWRAKLIPDTRIISQLEIIENKLTTEQEVENETYNDTLTDPPSQETVNLKDDTPETGDNSTPISNNIKNNHLNTPGPKLNTNTLIPVLNELKRKPVDVYDVDAPESESATKTYVKSNSGVPIKLLIPKIEKCSWLFIGFEITLGFVCFLF
ncbi:hypothetical protein LXL04_011703 [Taraxacum kok-saghyz]